ncbi:membrane dipeptidase-like protein [Parathielavia hyrcaniae]|uniref:Dipeptidase n=1 Tax=Parathielavia hyrcaniae TaxID=113614 RepID=A0AAN6Q6Y8_9PEZI|nr:membrane dipeptidase-like protein [Parathielavia hyrcaniae]
MKTSSESERPGTGPEAPESGTDRRALQRPRIAKAAVLVVLSLLLFVFLGRLDHRLPCLGHSPRPAEPKTIEERVKHILSQTPLIDGHNDLAITIRVSYNNHIYNETFSKPFAEGGLHGHVDIPRLKAGMSGGAFWSVFWPCPENGNDYSDENYHSIVQQTLQQIDLISRLRQAHPSVFSPPTLTGAAALDHFRRRPGQLISPLGIEGLHQIGNSAAALRQFHALGVRYATLTHNCGNRFADAALWERPLRRAPPVWGGVSPRGRRLVREMNRLGMVVDLAHVSVDTMLDGEGEGGGGWEGSRAPVIFSHSSAYALCPHPRNVPDEVLNLVREKRGLVMVNFNPEFVSCVAAPGREDGLPDFYPRNSTLQQVARHIVYIGKRIGYGHVGLGSDFDGIEQTPEGLEDVSKFPDLVAELLREGVSDEDAARVVGGNLLRVWREVDAVAEEMQKAGEPVLEDELPGLFPEQTWGPAREL